MVGGNIGRPVLELEPGPAERVFVLELSSYQLDLCERLRCRVAVWLNLTPDHLDRHGDLAGYIAAKERIFRHQAAGDVAVIGIDDAPSRRSALRLREQGREVVTVALSETMPATIAVRDGWLVDGDADESSICAASGNLRGRHNWQNVAVAYAAVRALGLSPSRPPPGCRASGGCRTGWRRSPAPAAWYGSTTARPPTRIRPRSRWSSFPCIFWIAGGKPKPGGFKSLRPALGNVRAAYLIGAAAAEIAADLGDVVPVHEAGTLEAAVRAASAAARAVDAAEAAVLLAPACASFDQFANFEARGDAFRALAVAEAGAA